MFEDRVVFYIDILGFTNFILDHEGKYNDVIEKSMNNILTISKVFDGSIQSKIDVSASIMSDSIVCSFVTGSLQKNKLNLTALLLACIAFQISLLRSGILSRGAIVKSGLNHKDNLVYGPAMIEVYNMERYEAIFPRVIIGKKIKEFINQIDDKRINGLISKDNDSIDYVDYIKRLEEFGCDREMIKKMMELKIKTEEDSVAQKYEWVKEKL